MPTLNTVATYFAIIGVPASLFWNGLNQFQRKRDRRLSEFSEDVKPPLQELLAMLTEIKSLVKALKTTSFGTLEEQLNEVSDNINRKFPKYQSDFNLLIDNYESWRIVFKLGHYIDHDFEDSVLENVLAITYKLEQFGERLPSHNSDNIGARVDALIKPAEDAINTLNDFKSKVENRKFFLRPNVLEHRQ